MRLKFEPGGGAERSLELLAMGLAERGHEVHVLTSAWEGTRPAGVAVRLVPAKGRGAARLKSFGEQAVKAMNGLKLDTCLSLERAPGVPVFRAGDGCHAAWLEHRAPYESMLKRMSFKFNPLHRTHLDLEKRTLTSPKLVRVIANSRLVADELRSYYGLDDSRVSVIYNGVDERRLRLAAGRGERQHVRAIMGAATGQPVLLFLGAGFERKGLAFALQALVGLPEAVLWVAGRDRPEPWERLAQRLGVARRVRFLGQRADAPRLIAAADALILPTIYDPCANSCLESLFIGTPVVTTLANGAAALIKEGVNGALVSEPSDYGALTAACGRALGLRRPVPHQVNGQNQWIEQVEQVLGQAAGEAGR